MRRTVSLFLAFLTFCSLAVSAYEAPDTASPENYPDSDRPVFCAYYDNSLACVFYDPVFGVAEGEYAPSDYNVVQGTLRTADTEEINGITDIEGALHMKSRTDTSEGSYRLKMNSPVKHGMSVMEAKSVTFDLFCRFANLAKLKDGLLDSVASPALQSAFHPGASYTEQTSPYAHNFGNVGYNIEVCMPSDDSSSPDLTREIVLSFGAREAGTVGKIRGCATPLSITRGSSALCSGSDMRCANSASPSETRLKAETLPILREVAGDRCCSIIDPRRVLPDPEEETQELSSLYVDGVHPNSEGYRLIAAHAAELVLNRSTDGSPIGDANVDLAVDVYDLAILAKKYAVWEGVSCSLFQSDVDQDGRFTFGDVQTLAKYLADWTVFLEWDPSKRI